MIMDLGSNTPMFVYYLSFNCTVHLIIYRVLEELALKGRKCFGLAEYQSVAAVLSSALSLAVVRVGMDSTESNNQMDRNSNDILPNLPSFSVLTINLSAL